MTPVISSSAKNVILIQGTPFTTRKTRSLNRCNLVRNSTRQTWSLQKYVLPLSTSVRSLAQFRSGNFLQHKSRIHITCATGTDLAIEEAGSPVADEDSGTASEFPKDAVGTGEESLVKSDASVKPAQSTRSRPTRKSEMPPVKPEELVPGATFTGKVMSIQPFGAFVDFGAFTDGLVHVSQLSDDFVKNVEDVVSIGQEVKVRLVEVNMETKRISLSMREMADTSRMQQRGGSPASSDKGRTPRQRTPRFDEEREFDEELDDEKKPFSNFETGQDLMGTVKNLTRSGAFISLPDGKEGFLPSAELMDDGFGDFKRDMGSSLEVGQEVSVRVLRVTRGQVTLTMKAGVGEGEEEDVGDWDSIEIQGDDYKPTNAFGLAFRKNKDMAAFLDEREKKAKPVENSGIPPTMDVMEEGNTSLIVTELNKVQHQQTSSSEADKIEGKFDQTGTKVGEMQDQIESSSKELISTLTEGNETSLKEVDVEASTVCASNEMVNDVEDPEIIVSDSSDGINGAVQSIEEVTEVRSHILAPEETVSASAQLTEGALAVDQSEVTQSTMSPENMISDSLQIVDSVAKSIEEKVVVSSEVLSPEGDGSAIEEVSITDGLENVRKANLSGQITDSIISDSTIAEEVTKIQPDDAIAKDEVQIAAPSAEIEPITATVVEELGINPDNNGSITSSNGQIDVPTLQQSTKEGR